MRKIKFIDKYGYPVERVKGRPVQNFFRILFLTRRIKGEQRWH